MNTHDLTEAYRLLGNYDAEQFFASGVVVHLTNLEGRPLAPAFVVNNGLSNGLVEAIRAELRTTLEYRAESLQIELNTIAHVLEES